MPMRRNTIDDFWKRFKIGSDNECWVWKGSLDKKWGYGKFNLFGEGLAHRISWVIHNGAIPDGMKVCHSCDNPPCVNPKHLWLGTDRDNREDMINKGRDRHLFGEQIPWSKLNNEKVKDIRIQYKNGATQLELSKKYGVSRSVVGHIVNRKKWKQVTD